MLNDYFYHQEKNNKDFRIKAIFDIPKKIFLTLLAIIISSVLCLYSSRGGNLYPWAIKQIYFALFSLFIFMVLVCINVKYIYKYSYHMLFLSIIFLVLVFFCGKRVLGASRWINFGIFKFQPSELAKISIILALSKYFSNINVKQIYSIKSNIMALLLVSPVLIFVVIQPDLATTIIIFGIINVIMFAVGISKWKFIYLIITGLLFLPIIWVKFLKDYQRLRIINFLFPENDPLGSGYNVIQSKIAIGSGGLFGKGFLEGTQGSLNFLPEHHTDFIFTIVGEEFGFIGSIILIGLYLIIVFYGISVSQNVNSIFAKLVCIGISSMIFLHVFINIGMTIALMPVAGIPLIMFSYGGTGLVVAVFCIALMVNIDINKNHI